MFRCRVAKGKSSETRPKHSSEQGEERNSQEGDRVEKRGSMADGLPWRLRRNREGRVAREILALAVTGRAMVGGGGRRSLGGG